MLYLVYVSSATQLMSDEELVGLLDQSRANNVRLGITGMLLYRDGNFMQVLEGEENTVRELAARIERDPRHFGFIRLLEDHADERQFAEWSMGFRNLSGAVASDAGGYSHFLDDRFDSPEYRQNPGRAWMLLKMFRKHN